MSSATSDPWGLALSGLFGLAGGIVTATKQGWWGLLVGVAIAAAVYGSIVVTNALLTRDGTREQRPSAHGEPATEQAEEFTARCRQALVDLPVHDPGVRATAVVLTELVETSSGSVHEHQVTTLILDDLRDATHQLERIDPESPEAEIERRLRYIKQSLQETIGIVRKLLGHSHSGD